VEITELSVFGSILQEDFKLDSDIAVFSRMRGNKILERLTVQDSNTPHSCDYRYIDLLVKFDPNAHISLTDMIKIENELKILLKRNIDLVSKKAIENSKNWIRRQNILNNSEIIYVQLSGNYFRPLSCS
jgi:predicted nucleotidyltransferase